MATLLKPTVLNDPIYGFISIQDDLLFALMQHPYFQRLRRISQMGLSYLVYPGAHHTRFQHALGSMYLMQKAIQTLRLKGVHINTEEESGVLAAILLHDIGHGPFSHAMEHSLVNGISHEQISLIFMEKLNLIFKGKLEIAISIFKGKHKKRFLNQLVSSQLDMDRLDYLKRDSFYTGVSEGNINANRLIDMLHVKEGNLVVEEKGIYSVEKFLMARRFMYWQVYLHKTALGAEALLIEVLRRAKMIFAKSTNSGASKALHYFLTHPININNFDTDSLAIFAKLDDVDVLAAIKQWQYHPDRVLSELCKRIIERHLLQVNLRDTPIAAQKVKEKLEYIKKKEGLSAQEASHFVLTGKVSNQAYDNEKQHINILKDDGKLVDVTKASDHLNLKALSMEVTKYYFCYPKNSV